MILLPYADAEAWRQLVDRVAIHGPIPIVLEVQTAPSDVDGFEAATLVVRPIVRERASGRWIRTTARAWLPAWLTERAALEFLRATVREVYLHETDEAIVLGEDRPFDPHPEAS